MNLSYTRKGQFYLLTSVILIVAMFTLINAAPQVSKQFSDNIKKSYDTEARNIINHAIYTGTNEVDELKSFTYEFIDFQAEKGNKLGIVFMVKSDNVTIFSTIPVYANGILVDDSLNINTQNITLTYEDIDYRYEWQGFPVEFYSFMVKK